MQHSEPSTREIGLMHKVYKPTIFRALASVLPSSVHPNAITLTGQACAGLAVVASYHAARGHPLLYPASAVLYLLYLASDNVDGMHARRTGQVSRTGELLDHGLDGMAILCLSLTFGFVLHIDGPFFPVVTILPAIAFFLAHWEHRRTGVFGPVTGQADGYTLGAALSLAAFALHDPPALTFSFQVLNAASVLVLALLPASLFAVTAPMFRARRQGSSLTELVVPVSVLVLLEGYVYAGAPAWWVAAMVGIVGTEFGMRAIRLRLSAAAGGLVARRHVALVLPLIVDALYPSQSLSQICVLFAAVATVWSFGIELVSGLRVTHALDVRASRPAH